jgi:hypothetical protein
MDDTYNRQICGLDETYHGRLHEAMELWSSERTERF